MKFISLLYSGKKTFNIHTSKAKQFQFIRQRAAVLRMYEVMAHLVVTHGGHCDMPELTVMHDLGLLVQCKTTASPKVKCATLLKTSRLWRSSSFVALDRFDCELSWEQALEIAEAIATDYMKRVKLSLGDKKDLQYLICRLAVMYNAKGKKEELTETET